MIRIVKEVYCTDLDAADGVLHKMPMIPATAEYEEKSTVDKHGRLLKINLSFTARHLAPWMRNNLAITTVFDNGKHKHFGTEDIPVRLSITESSTINVSCEYKTAEI